MELERVDKEKKKREREKREKEREREKKREEEKQRKKLTESFNFLGDTASPDMIKIQKEKHKEHKEKQSKIRERERKLYQGKFVETHGAPRHFSFSFQGVVSKKDEICYELGGLTVNICLILALESFELFTFQKIFRRDYSVVTTHQIYLILSELYCL